MDITSMHCAPLLPRLTMLTLCGILTASAQVAVDKLDRIASPANAPRAHSGARHTKARKSATNDAGRARRTRSMQLRAAYILKVACDITDKNTATAQSAPYVIGVVGDDDFVAAIQQLLPGKEVDKRSVKVVALAPKAAAHCNEQRLQMLDVASNVDPIATTRLIRSYKQIATALPSEQSSFAKIGGGLQLFLLDNKVKFEVNQATLKAQGLHVSPHLIKLSTEGPSE